MATKCLCMSHSSNLGFLRCSGFHFFFQVRGMKGSMQSWSEIAPLANLRSSSLNQRNRLQKRPHRYVIYVRAWKWNQFESFEWSVFSSHSISIWAVPPTTHWQNPQWFLFGLAVKRDVNWNECVSYICLANVIWWKYVESNHTTGRQTQYDFARHKPFSVLYEFLARHYLTSSYLSVIGLTLCFATHKTQRHIPNCYPIKFDIRRTAKKKQPEHIYMLYTDTRTHNYFAKRENR